MALSATPQDERVRTVEGTIRRLQAQRVTLTADWAARITADLDAHSRKHPLGDLRIIEAIRGLLRVARGQASGTDAQADIAGAEKALDMLCRGQWPPPGGGPSLAVAIEMCRRLGLNLTGEDVQSLLAESEMAIANRTPSDDPDPHAGTCQSETVSDDS